MIIKQTIWLFFFQYQIECLTILTHPYWLVDTHRDKWTLILLWCDVTTDRKSKPWVTNEKKKKLGGGIRHPYLVATAAGKQTNMLFALRHSGRQLFTVNGTWWERERHTHSDTPGWNWRKAQLYANILLCNMINNVSADTELHHSSPSTDTIKVQAFNHGKNETLNLDKNLEPYADRRHRMCSDCHSKGLFSPISHFFPPSRRFATFLPSTPFAEWAPSWQHALAVLIIPRLVSASVEIPFTYQPWNSAGSFVLFFVIKTPIWGLAFALTDRGGEGGREGRRERGREGGRREGGGGYQSAQKISRVSSQSDENILNANGGKLPRVKLNSGQELKKNVQRGEALSKLCLHVLPPCNINFICWSHLCRARVNWWISWKHFSLFKC